MDKDRATELALKVSWWSMAVNLFLSLIKLIAGLVAHSVAMVADAVHSASDVFSTVIVIAALHASAKEEDHDHEYGHEKYENIAALGLAFVLALTGLGIGWKGIESLREKAPELPGMLALAAAVVSILTKELMFRRTIAIGREVDSDALVADAWHHRSDAMSSVASLAGIAAARHGFPFMDAVAGILVCGFILKTAFEIFMSSARKLTDAACDAKEEAQMREAILSIPGVLRLDMLKTRLFGSGAYVDVEISVDSACTLIAAHDIAKAVHDRIEGDFAGVKHCMVHVNPLEVGAPSASEKE